MNMTTPFAPADSVSPSTKGKLGFSHASGLSDGESDEEGEDGDEDEEDLNIKNSDLIFHPESMLRSWLKKRGK